MPEQTTPNKAGLITALTGMRGYAALWVALSHFSFTGTLSQPFGMRIHWGMMEGILRHEYLAVDLFFMLSGFVLMHVHGHEFQQRITPDTHKNFLLLRLARIYPLHLLSLLFMLALQLVDTEIDGLRTPFSFVTQLLLVASWGINYTLSWNLPSWSLSSEWLGYLLFPFMAITANKIRHPIGQFVGIGFIFFAFYWLMFRSNIHMNYSNGAGATVRVLCGMGVGVLLQRLHDTPYISRATWTLMFWLAMPLALATMTDLDGKRLKESVWAVVMMAALLITASRAQGWLMLPLTHRAAVYLGEISYAIYILHYPVFRFLRWIGTTHYTIAAEYGSMTEVYILSLGTFGFLIGCAALAHHTIEKPVRRWVKQRIESRQSF